jgi:hypothetical protein
MCQRHTGKTQNAPRNCFVVCHTVKLYYTVKSSSIAMCLLSGAQHNKTLRLMLKSTYNKLFCKNKKILHAPLPTAAAAGCRSALSSGLEPPQVAALDGASMCRTSGGSPSMGGGRAAAREEAAHHVPPWEEVGTG